MKLTPIDGTSRLFSVSDVYTDKLISEVLSIDWLNQPMEEDDVIHRKNIHPVHPAVDRLNETMIGCLPLINLLTNNTFTCCHGSMWWLNTPGFMSSIHHDGSLNNNLLMYWHAPDEYYGTTFYNSDNKHDILHQFKSIPGTGYLMLNHAEPDGTRPPQWHGMLKEVPPGQHRISCYWHFS